jgi:DNA gyrase subunit A
LNITEKTGKLVAIKSVTEDNDLMIINKSGITIRMNISDIRIMGRATQGVRLINLEKRNDQIASVCKVDSEDTDDENVGLIKDDELETFEVNYQDSDEIMEVDEDQETLEDQDEDLEI